MCMAGSCLYPTRSTHGVFVVQVRRDGSLQRASSSWLHFTCILAWLNAVSVWSPGWGTTALAVRSSRRLPPVLLISLAAPAHVGCGIVHGDVTTSNVLLQRCIAPQHRRRSPCPTPSTAADAASPPTTVLPVPRPPWEPSSTASLAGQGTEMVLEHDTTAQDTGTAPFPVPGSGSASQEAAATMCAPPQSTANRPVWEPMPPAYGATGACLQPDPAYAAVGGGSSTILSSSCLAAATCSSLSTLLQQQEAPTFQQENTLQQLQPAHAAAPCVTVKDWDQQPFRGAAPLAGSGPEATWQPFPGLHVSPAAAATLRGASSVGGMEELRAPQLDPLDKLRATLGLGLKAKVGGRSRGSCVPWYCKSS